MALVIVHSDELRGLVQRERETRSSLDSALSDIASAIGGTDKRGWNAGAVDAALEQARGLVRAVDDSLQSSSIVLLRKADLVDELSGRSWPGVFNVASLFFGSLGAATKWLIPTLRETNSVVGWLSHVTDAIAGLTWLTRWRHVEFTIEKLAAPFLSGEASDALAKAVGSVGRDLKALSPDLADELQSSGVERGFSVLGRALTWVGASIQGLTKFSQTYAADIESDRERALFGAVAAGATAFAITLGVGVLALSSSPVLLGAGLALGGLSLISAVTGHKELDVVGNFTDWASGEAAQGGRSVYDTLEGTSRVQATVRLGGAMAGPPSAGLGSPVETPGVGTLPGVSLRARSFLSQLAPSIVGTAPGGLWRRAPSWVRDVTDDLIGSLEPPVRPPLAVLPTPQTAPVTSSGPPLETFGDVMARWDRTKGNAPAGYSNDYSNVPVEAQGTLAGSAACVPTSVSMVTEYYHNVDVKLPAEDPRQMLGLLDPGELTPGSGMQMSDITDEVTKLGYGTARVEVGSNMDELKKLLHDGPVVMAGGVSYPAGNGPMPGNYSHAMVVEGMSDDGSRVLINDPWLGKRVELSAKTFESIWAKQDNQILLIRP